MVLRLAALVIFCIATVQASHKVGGVPRNDIHRVARAVFNQRGVSGDVTFTQERLGAPIGIQVDLVGLDQFTDNYRWSIHEYPVRTSLLLNYPCSDAVLGGIFNGNSLVSGSAIGDLTTKVGRIRFDMPQQRFLDPNLYLFAAGPEQSVIGRSLVIDRQDGPNGSFICANIEASSRPGGRASTLRASFNNDEIQGDVIIRKADGLDLATVDADIYKVDSLVSMDGQGFSWTLNFGPCTNIGQVYGSAAYNPAVFSCSMERQRECIIGDLTSKCGALDFEGGSRARAFCADSQLGTVNFASLNGLVVHIFRDGNISVGCAPLQTVQPLRAEASFREFTVVGNFIFYQDGPNDETFIKAFLTGLPRSGVPYSLRIYSGVGTESNPCGATELGSIYDVPNRALFTSGNGVLTPDGCRLGNLEGVLPIESNQAIQRTVSTSIPLFGPFSVIGRTLAVVNGMNDIVACAPIKNSCTTCPLQSYNSILGYQDLNNPVI